MLVYVTHAKYIDKYQLDVLFNNKKQGVVDLESIIKNDHRLIVKELIDLKKFKSFRVDLDTVVWKNGFDLAPEFLYSNLQRSRLIRKKKKSLRTRIKKVNSIITNKTVK